MKCELLALTMLEQYRKLLLDQSCLEYEDLDQTIKQLKDLEHYSHYTSGLWCTDRPDLLSDDFKKDYAWQINFWDKYQQ